MYHRLLVADASITVQRVVALAFSGYNVDVLTAGDGAQAIASVVMEHPDIVLADVRLPKYTGYDVAALVKSRSDLQHIPVLLLAGAFEQLDEPQMHQVGCDGLIIKPFDPGQLLSRVQALLPELRSRLPRETAARLLPPRSLALPSGEPARNGSPDASSELLGALVATLRATSPSLRDALHEITTEDDARAATFVALLEQLTRRVIARLQDEQLVREITEHISEKVQQILRDEIAVLQRRECETASDG